MICFWRFVKPQGALRMGFLTNQSTGKFIPLGMAPLLLEVRFKFCHMLHLLQGLGP